MSGKEASKRSKKGRPKKQPYSSLFPRLGTESNLDKAEDAYNAFFMGDHFVRLVCGKHNMPLDLGFVIQEAVMTHKEPGDISVSAKILAKYGEGMTVLVNLMLKHRKDLENPTQRQRVQRVALDIQRYLEENGPVNLKCAAEQITGENLTSKGSTVNDAMCALLHHYSGTRVSPDNIRKTLRRVQKQLLGGGKPPN